MKLGFIGLGMVGKAIYDVMAESFDTYFYDIKYPDSSIRDVITSDVVFIAVPTLPDMYNRCDLSILTSVMDELHALNYPGIICIKSTITPETTQNYIKKYANERICFCPEFLRERCAYEDFKFNNHICVVGTVSTTVYDTIRMCHANICREFRMVSPIEAELTKYFQNVYNTNRVLFANAFYEVCTHHDICYNSIVDTLVVRKEMDDKYLRCDERLRGPSGPCLVKDTLAFNEYVQGLELNIKPTIFQAMVDDMKLYPKTVIEGTRNELEYFGKEL